MKNITMPLLCFSTLIMTTALAQGALTLVVNPTTHQFALIGSSTGFPLDDGYNYEPVTIQYDGPLGDGFAFSGFTVPTSANFFTIDRYDANYSLRITASSNRVSIAFLFDSADELTISGTGVFLDYGARFADAFESPAKYVDALPDGALLFVNDGSGFDGGITVQIVPEPSAALLGLLGLFPLLRRRRN